MKAEEIHEKLKEQFPEAILRFIEGKAPPPKEHPKQAAKAAEGEAPKAEEAKGEPPQLDSLIEVTPQGLPAVASFLKNNPEMDFNYLVCISGVDLLKLPKASDEDKKKILVIYHLESFEPETGRIRHRVALQVPVDRDAAEVPSVAAIWATADWNERETFDLIGVKFAGHPNLRRILCDDDWNGHALRKDFVFPTEYRGIDLR